MADTNLDKYYILQYNYVNLKYREMVTVKLGEKIRYLREVEGSLRGLGRAMTQLELVRAIREEIGARGAKGSTISQSYLSQIENGASPAYDAIIASIARQIFQGSSGLSCG